MKEIFKQYIKFYKNNIKTKHIVCTIVSIIILIIFTVSDIYQYSNLSENVEYNKLSYLNSLKENAMLSFLIIFAGITPYCFLSVIGFSAIYNVAHKISVMYIISGSIIKLILLCIVAILVIISYSLCIASGIYYCILSSKRFSYSQKKGFGLNDFKTSIYKLRNKEDKVKELEEIKMKELQKNEKLNVNVPYINLTISYIISIIILIVTGIFIR